MAKEEKNEESKLERIEKFGVSQQETGRIRNNNKTDLGVTHYNAWATVSTQMQKLKNIALVHPACDSHNYRVKSAKRTKHRVIRRCRIIGISGDGD